MPTKAARPCTRCGEPQRNQGRCDACTERARRDSPYQEPDRPTPAQRGYDTAHRKRRNAYLRDHPECEARGCTNPSIVLDHADGDSSNNHPDNHQALCHPCHSRKTAQVDGGFGRPPLPRNTP